MTNLLRINPYLTVAKFLKQMKYVWLAYAVSKAPRNFFEEDFRKTFNKLLERIELDINNNGNYPRHLIK
jgi:hypothetical protein